jgi:hypothetical protein
MKKLMILLSLAACFFFLNSCTSEISLTLNKNGSVSVGYYGAAGKGFMGLLKNSAGAKNDDVMFDAKAITKELEKSGFKDVNVICKNKNDISVQMTDTQKKSEYFTSGLVKVTNNKLKITLSPAGLKKFYESTDSQTAAYLDMLLSPVFNDDSMTETEYLDLVSSFYGKEVSDEIKNTEILLTITNPDGKKSKHTVKMIKLLTLNESLQLE